MNDKVDLGGGAWAKLRDPHDVPERKRRPLDKVQRILAGSRVGEVLLRWHEEHGDEKPDEKQMRELLFPLLADDEMDLFDSSNDLLIVALVEEWSLDRPVTVDEVQDLPGRAYRALKDACEPLLGLVLGNENEADVFDPDSPSTPGSV